MKSLEINDTVSVRLPDSGRWVDGVLEKIEDGPRGRIYTVSYKTPYRRIGREKVSEDSIRGYKGMKVKSVTVTILRDHDRNYDRLFQQADRATGAGRVNAVNEQPVPQGYEVTFDRLGQSALDWLSRYPSDFTVKSLPTDEDPIPAEVQVKAIRHRIRQQKAMRMKDVRGLPPYEQYKPHWDLYVDRENMGRFPSAEAARQHASRLYQGRKVDIRPVSGMEAAGYGD